jgi:predicted flap endonuclease-1-like 5' DNA nuclease
MDKFQIGPAGGNGGKPFDHYEVPNDAHLTAIHIYTEWVINALQFDYVDADGNATGKPPIGGLGGEHHVFYLDDDEYLIGISGRAGWYIDSIRFHTNRRVSPTYGGTGGDRDFSFEAPAGFEIGGLFGRSAWYIDALGVQVRRHIEQAADDISGADDEEEYESWLELAGEGEPLPASVVVRRAVIIANEALDELEDAALAEALAGIVGDKADEGTADAAVYTQVIEDGETGQTIAIVLAVASPIGNVETVGDDPDEVAVMVTDSIESDEDIALLEEEAVEGAIDMLLEGMDEEADEVEVTIYSGVHEDEESGKAYGAVVAIATRLASPEVEIPTRGSPAKKSTAENKPAGKDLELIEGIGPKIAELLMAHDINNLADLATVPVDKLREILTAAGKRFRLADPATWPEQAALGASGLWDALSELQARLKAGR